MVEAESVSSSSSLLAEVQRGEPEAWRRMTAIYGPVVFKWCRRAGLQAADAADVVQLVFSTVAAKIGDFQSGRPGDRFRGWLWTIFHSRLMDFYRTHRRWEQAVGDSEVKRLKDAEPITPPATEQFEEEEDSTELVRRALAIIRHDFNETTWQAFWRTAVEGEAVSDTAREIKMSPAAVCMARSRVLRRLRETLGGLGLFAGDEV